MRNFRLDDESGHQEALFSWAAYRTEIMPELQYMYHVPNGGKRDKATAAVLKRLACQTLCYQLQGLGIMGFT